MIVAEVMTHEPSSCTPGDTLASAARVMWERDCGAVPVVDSQRRVLGMITDRDICMAAYLRGQRLDECTIGDVMSRPVIACRPADAIERAEAIMRDHRIRRLPVIDENGCLEGILSMNDLILAAPAGPKRTDIRPDVVVSTLAIICQHRQQGATAHA
jgi:CBS domain-containing protein